MIDASVICIMGALALSIASMHSSNARERRSVFPVQDVVRLLLFVNISEFSEIENRAPGIVAAASDLLPEILIAATQPPRLDAARLDHSVQWHDLCEAAQAESGRRRHSTGGSGRPNPRCDLRNCATSARLCVYACMYMLNVYRHGVLVISMHGSWEG